MGENLPNLVNLLNSKPMLYLITETLGQNIYFYTPRTYVFADMDAHAGK
jgi:hypothetical protein